MRSLIVGIGALGGTIAARALKAGMPVSLATRSAESARALRGSGLRVSGVGGEAAARSVPVAALEEYARGPKFELILLATKAHDALSTAPFLVSLLEERGTLLCIQNGGVAQMLAEKFGRAVLGGLSNLGATMMQPGLYEQRNAGHLLVGELQGGLSERALNSARFLSGAIETRASANMRGAVWSKLLLNCSVTTIGAVAGATMRQYIALPAGAQVFRAMYAEALAVAAASGVRLEKMIVDPVPPRGDDTGFIAAITSAYGDLKPSMLQDFERGRQTEIDFINGYVARLGKDVGIPAPLNAAVTEMAHRIERGELRPGLDRLRELAQRAA